MSFEWDQNKATANLKKHSIDFADAVTVFDDLNAITIADPDYDEERFTKLHGIMLGMAYFLTLINVSWLFFEDASSFTAMNVQYLFDPSNMIMFVHPWHIWLGIISMVLGTLALITHLGGWKTCNLGLPAVVLWTILGFTGMYLGLYFRM